MSRNVHGRAFLFVTLTVAVVAVFLFFTPVVERMCVERELSAAIAEYDSTRRDLDGYLSATSRLRDKCAQDEVYTQYCDSLAMDSEGARILVQAGVPTGHDPSDIDSIRDRLTVVRAATAELTESRARLMEMVAQAPMGDAGQAG